MMGRQEPFSMSLSSLVVGGVSCLLPWGWCLVSMTTSMSALPLMGSCALMDKRGHPCPLRGSSTLFLYPPVGETFPGGWYLVQMATSMSVAVRREWQAILRFDGQTGAPLPAPGQSDAVFVPAGSGRLNFSSGLVFGPDDHLYVSSSGSNTILRFDGHTGALLNAFVPSGSGGLSLARRAGIWS